MKTTSYLIAVLIMGLTFGLAGCGPKAGADPEPENAATTEVEATDEATDEGEATEDEGMGEDEGEDEGMDDEEEL